MPRSSTMTEGSLSSSMTAANTCLACLDEMASSASSFTSSTARAGVSGLCAKVGVLAGVQPCGDVVDGQVGNRLRQLGGILARNPHARLEEVGRSAMIDQVASVVGGQAELIGEASGLLVGQLGQLGADAFDELIGKVVGRQVGLGEQAVVVSGFLHAHDDGVLHAWGPNGGSPGRSDRPLPAPRPDGRSHRPSRRADS